MVSLKPLGKRKVGGGSKSEDGSWLAPNSADEGTVASLAAFLPSSLAGSGAGGAEAGEPCSPAGRDTDRACCPLCRGSAVWRKHFLIIIIIIISLKKKNPFFFFLFIVGFGCFVGFVLSLSPASPLLLVGPCYLCPSLQVVVLASNWAVVDMLMRRLGCG